MSETNTLSLGAMLRDNIRKENERIAREAQEKADAKHSKITTHFATIKAAITHDIKKGGTENTIKMPNELRSMRDFMKPISHMQHEDHHYWVEFCAWLEENGLQATVGHDHDGGGMDDWFVITYSPAD